MGGLVIETIRPGVQFTPHAANAFRRAEAQVQREFGRNIGVNSTHRSWDQQMRMYNAWNAYVNGTGPYPGHSKAIHPRYSLHTNGTALDSNDWRNVRIRQILADNGFIRNQLHVPNEQHHFEYIRSSDKNFGKPIGNEDDLTPEQGNKLNAIYAALFGNRNNTGKADPISWVNIAGDVQTSNYGVLPIVIHNQTLIVQQASRIAELEKLIEDQAPTGE